MEVCKICGLPKDLCVCESISKESQKIIVRTDRRRYRKFVTLVEGIDPKQVNLDDLTKNLKNKLACGGTHKEGVIELQGNHTKRILPVLEKLGFPKNTIDIRSR